MELHWKCVPDGCGCDIEASITSVTVEHSSCWFKLYLLSHWQPMKNVIKSQCDMFTFADSNK